MCALLGLGAASPITFADGPVSVNTGSVDVAIARGVTWLKAQRNDGGHWESGSDDGARESREWGGDSGLALLALLYAGEDEHQEYMESSLRWLAAQKLTGTYTHGVRAHVLALTRDKSLRARLGDDVEWLIKAPFARGAERPGAYGYEAVPSGVKSGWWDNSNSQFGVLGVWMGSDAGIGVPTEYWEVVRDHWLDTQLTDGGWGYNRESHKSTGSMSAAGLATLFVALDRLHSARNKEYERLVGGVDAGLWWFAREYSPANPGGESQWRYYYLYGVERVGRASGYKYFRNRDWFREGAAALLREQQQAGHWRGSAGNMGDLRNTAFALMFLCHGRAPIMFNKLEHAKDWNDRLRDAAQLAHFAEQSLETLLNWQIVNFSGPIDDLLEAPVLYLRGASRWEFDEVQADRLREYALRGGLILAVAGEGNAEFTLSMRELAKAAFPGLPMRSLPPTHPLFTGEVQFPIDKPPAMFEVSNGRRTLMLLCTEDVAAAWHEGPTRSRLPQFQLGCNVYVYATDKTRVGSKLDTVALAAESVEIARTINIARIRYDGDWDIEPYGWTRLATYMNNAARTRLLVTSGVSWASPDLNDFKIAWMTGTKAFVLNEDERAGMRKFLAAGGTLLADAAMASPEFLEAFEREIGDALKEPPHLIESGSAFFSGQGIPDAADLSVVGYRRSARVDTRERRVPPLKAFSTRQRMAVIYAPLDVSVGLLGTPVYGLKGYDPDGVLRIARNMLLYAELPTVDKARLSGGKE
ncbi:hypothetical protein RAS1_01940 [Phycisphaerae bacterium RAS1]|nr:hypothetical protein RAS1_01940 [Phycisphaerae bacterium RAS1]